jgi:5-methylcytosine-specific restriction endonuclease McrA
MADELAERERQREQDRQGRRQAVQQNGKHCTRCEQTLPVSAFNSDARYVDGYQSYCRGCMRGYHTERRVDPTYTEGERKRGRDYYQQKREVIAPKRRAYDRGRWHTDPKYRQRKNIQKHQRREYLRGLVEHFTQEEWQALCEKYDNRCLKCGERKPLTVDHIVPVSKGGTNDIHNVQPLCLDCNMRKHTKTIDYRPLAQAAMGLDM